MERIEFLYPAATEALQHRAHVGVVGSGDLEVLITPSETGTARVFILTGVNGFEGTWRAVMDRFFASYRGAVDIRIHDAGATPGCVLLRLQQAVEELHS